MKVRFLDSVAGVGFAYRIGREYDLPEEVATEFIDARLAVLVEELAVKAPPETAARRAPGPRGGRRRKLN